MKKSFNFALVAFAIFAFTACSDENDPVKPDPTDHTQFYPGKMLLPMKTTIFYEKETDNPVLTYRYIKKDVYENADGKYSRVYYERTTDNYIDTLAYIIVPDGLWKGIYCDEISSQSLALSFIKVDDLRPGSIAFMGETWTYKESGVVYKDVSGSRKDVYAHFYYNEELQSYLILDAKTYEFIGINLPNDGSYKFYIAQKGYHILPF